MLRIPGFALVAGLSLLLASTAWAQSAPRIEGDRAGAQSVYDAEVPVNSQGEAERTGAIARALGVVLGKLSGDRNVTGRPGVGSELRNAKDYVDSYDYRQDQDFARRATNSRIWSSAFAPGEVDARWGGWLPVGRSHYQALCGWHRSGSDRAGSACSRPRRAALRSVEEPDTLVCDCTADEQALGGRWRRTARRGAA